jgi:tetratricopeptide (TPR) repeat protein
MKESKEPPLIRLARYLKDFRLDAGWSEAALARRADLPTQVIRDYEADPSMLSYEVGKRVLAELHPEKVQEWLVQRALREQECSEPGMPPPEVLDQMESRMLELEAALRIDERRFHDALSVLDRALDLDERQERTGRLLLSKAAVLGELGREMRALQVLQEAERCLYLNRKKQRTLWLRLRLDQIYFLCYAEQFKDASAFMSETLDLAKKVGTPANKMEASWLTGRVFAGLGNLKKAIAVLESVSTGYLQDGWVFEGLTAALDLAAVLTAQGDHARVQQLAHELESWTQDKKLTDASRTTLRMFCKVAGRGMELDRARRFAGEFRRSDTRLTRPYRIPA